VTGVLAAAQREFGLVLVADVQFGELLSGGECVEEGGVL
jgi:hypothetical protein